MDGVAGMRKIKIFCFFAFGLLVTNQASAQSSCGQAAMTNLPNQRVAPNGYIAQPSPNRFGDVHDTEVTVNGRQEQKRNTENELKRLKLKECEDELRVHRERTDLARLRVEARQRWMMLDARQRECIDAALQLEASSIEMLIKDGIFPSRSTTIDVINASKIKC